jgi:hypothetical protein
MLRPSYNLHLLKLLKECVFQTVINDFGVPPLL